MRADQSIDRQIDDHQIEPEPPVLHIAMVANTTWNIYNFRVSLIRAFQEQGWQVSVIAPVDQYIVYLDDLPGVKHLLLDKKGYDGHVIKRRSSLFNTSRIDHLYQDPHEEHQRLFLLF